MLELIDIVQLMLIIAILLSALYSIMTKKLAYAVGGFTVMSILLGILFYLLMAPLVAAFQLVIYAGTVTVLMLVVLSLTRGVEE